MAVRMETHGKALLPVERWQDAVGKLYATTPAAQRKSGPKQTFLGLCEAGLVKGIAAGQYSPSNRNKGYALAAVDLLRAGSHRTVTQLWAAVAGEGDKTHASQMDVVLALWKNGLLVGS